MYRLFLIFALLNFVNSAEKLSQTLCRGDISKYCRPSKARHYGLPHNYYHGNGQTETVTPDQTSLTTVRPPLPAPPANTFEDLAQNLAAAEAAVRKYCRDNSNGDVREVYGSDSYILKYTLYDFKESDIKVKIKNNVIYVTANQVGLASFKDMRILPNILKTRQASWSLENNFLKVMIPYNVIFKRDVVNDCGDDNDAVIDVPSVRAKFELRTNETQQPTTENKVETTTAPINKEAETMSIDDALSIISPTDYENFDIDIRSAQK